MCAGRMLTQQVLGLRPLDAHQFVLLRELGLIQVLLLHEVAQEQEHHRGQDGEVQHEEHRHRAHRHARGVALGEEVVEHARHHREHGVGDEPRNRFAVAVDHHRADGCEQREQHDARRTHETADRPLDRERHEQEQRELREPVVIEVLGLEVVGEQHRRGELVAERQAGGQLEPHQPVDREPQEGRDVHEAGGEQQQRLAQPQLVGIRRVDGSLADALQPGRASGRDAADRVCVPGIAIRTGRCWVIGTRSGSGGEVG